MVDYHKALTMLKREQVTIDKVSSRTIYFKVKDYNVRCTLNPLDWHCTCKHQVFATKGQLCSHVRAAKLKLQNNLKEHWK